MNIRNRNAQEMMIRVVHFARERPDLLNPAAREIVPRIVASIAEIDRLRDRQIGGAQQRHQSVRERREIARDLEQALRDIAQTARVLGRAGNQALAAKLAMPRRLSYDILLGLGDAFASALESPADQALFTRRGFPDSFVDDLQTLVIRFREATLQKLDGVNTSVSGTHSLAAAVRTGVDHVLDLDAILSRQLRRTHPAIHASWKDAIRIAKVSRAKAPQPPAAAEVSHPTNDPVSSIPTNSTPTPKEAPTEGSSSFQMVSVDTPKRLEPSPALAAPHDGIITATFWTGFTG